MDVKIPVELPAIDLSGALPLIALVLIAALILVTLLARTLILSRAAALAVFAVIVISGGTVITAGISALTVLIGVAGAVVIVGVIVLNRNREVVELVRDVVRPQVISSSGWTVERLPSPKTEALPAPRRVRKSNPKIPPGWL